MKYHRMVKVMVAIEMVHFPWPEFELFADQKSHFLKARYCATVDGKPIVELWKFSQWEQRLRTEVGRC